MTYQQRVIDEYSHEQDKLTKLSTFTEGDVFPTLPLDEQRRLLRQETYMALFVNVLVERIEAFS